MSVENIWECLIENLKEGQVLKNWTKANGYFGDDIIIKKIKKTSMDIDAPNSSSGKITKVLLLQKEVEALYEVWYDYLDGKIGRKKIREKHRNARYIFDILNHLTVTGLID